MRMRARILLLPGWQNSSSAHWQSLWEAKYGDQRVAQHDWMRPLRGDWITRLEEVLLQNSEHSAQTLRRLEVEKASKNKEKPPSDAASATQASETADTVLVAHSLGCHLVAAWAALSQNTHRIRGAFLVAPPDAQREDFPLEMKSWRQPALQKLPFPSICVLSSNDPFCALATGLAMASAWGRRSIELGARGHINADSGLGDWPQGREWLRELSDE
jgi:uncharacterized protein